MTGGWRKLHNLELRNWYPLPSIIGMIKSWRMRWARHIARTWKKRNACRLFGESQRKRPIGKSSCSLLDNIKNQDEVLYPGMIYSE
jgi:hypothetical protein